MGNSDHHDQLSRRDALKLTAVAASGSIFASFVSAEESRSIDESKGQKRPNFVIFMTDGQRSDQLSFMAYNDSSALPWVQCKINGMLNTPNMDRVAREGLQLRNAFAVNALCAPARGAVLSGLYSQRNGVIDNNDRPLAEGVKILSDYLHEAGYEVAFCGKSHIKNALRDHYWDYYFAYQGQQPYLNPRIAEGRHGHIGPDKEYRGYVDDLVTNAAVRWLLEKREKPFCLFVWLKVPHGEGIRPRHLEDLYDGVSVSKPETFDDDLKGYPGKPRALANATNKLGTFEYCATLEQMVKSHNANTVAGDEFLGRLLGVLEETHKLDDTAVMHTSDHGYFLGEWHCIDKRLMHEPSIRIPLNIRYPKLFKPGTVIDQMILNIDIAPTVLDMAGLQIPPKMQGRSIVPLTRGEVPGWRKDWLYSFYDYPSVNGVPKNHGVRTERYKFIEYYEQTPKEYELYDLQEDPRELHNLYGDPHYGGLAQELMKRLTELRAETGEA